MLEWIEAHTRHGAPIFCTQFETDGWYFRIDSNLEFQSPICEAIMDEAILVAYEFLMDGKNPCEKGMV